MQRFKDMTSKIISFSKTVASPKKIEAYKDRNPEEQPSDDIVDDPIDEIIQEIDDGLWDL